MRTAMLSITLLSLTLLSVGCFDCRPVERRDLALQCSASASFRGELHLDSAATFRSFLADRCLPDADASVIDNAVAAVDFTTEVVFIAKGQRSSISRCIEGRAVESADACTDGLRIVFDDQESGIGACPGDWTVAFAMPRADMRAIDAL